MSETFDPSKGLPDNFMEEDGTVENTSPLQEMDTTDLNDNLVMDEEEVNALLQSGDAEETFQQQDPIGQFEDASKPNLLPSEDNKKVIDMMMKMQESLQKRELMAMQERAEYRKERDDILTRVETLQANLFAKQEKTGNIEQSGTFPRPKPQTFGKNRPVKNNDNNNRVFKISNYKGKEDVDERNAPSGYRRPNHAARQHSGYVEPSSGYRRKEETLSVAKDMLLCRPKRGGVLSEAPSTFYPDGYKEMFDKAVCSDDPLCNKKWYKTEQLIFPKNEWLSVMDIPEIEDLLDAGWFLREKGNVYTFPHGLPFQSILPVDSNGKMEYPIFFHLKMDKKAFSFDSTCMHALCCSASSRIVKKEDGTLEYVSHICSFCNGLHDRTECWEYYEPSARSRQAFRLGLCRACLKPWGIRGHSFKTGCPAMASGKVYCRFCKKKDHDPSFCTSGEAIVARGRLMAEIAPRYYLLSPGNARAAARREGDFANNETLFKKHVKQNFGLGVYEEGPSECNRFPLEGKNYGQMIVLGIYEQMHHWGTLRQEGKPLTFSRWLTDIKSRKREGAYRGEQHNLDVESCIESNYATSNTEPPPKEEWININASLKAMMDDYLPQFAAELHNSINFTEQPGVEFGGELPRTRGNPLDTPQNALMRHLKSVRTADEDYNLHVPVTKSRRMSDEDLLEEDSGELLDYAITPLEYINSYGPFPQNNFGYGKLIKHVAKNLPDLGAEDQKLLVEGIITLRKQSRR